MASCDVDSSFLSFPHPELFFFFFLVKKRDYRYTFPPWPSCAGFRQIYFSKHLWTLMCVYVCVCGSMRGGGGVCLQKRPFVQSVCE